MMMRSSPNARTEQRLSECCLVLTRARQGLPFIAPDTPVELGPRLLSASPRVSFLLPPFSPLLPLLLRGLPHDAAGCR